MAGKKRKLPPALQENADKLKRGERVGSSKKKTGKKSTRKTK
jgi:hypothetical protein